MKEEFSLPEITVVLFMSKDVITTSSDVADDDTVKDIF